MLKNVLKSQYGWVGNSYCDENLWILATDYGTYSCFFHYSSGTLKEFLVSCNSEYLVRKLIPQEERRTLNWDQTVKDLKKHVLESRRSRDISETTAKDLWFNLCWNSECEQQYAYSDETVDDWYEFVVYDESNQSIAFRKYVIEPFLEIYKKEIENGIHN